jgi:TolB-like protein
MKLLIPAAAPRALRFLLAGAVLALGLPLLAATTPTALVNPPVVVVYPLIGAQGVANDVGSSVALVIATQIAQLGGITVKAAPQGTQQADFLTAAQKLNADYYVTGFVTPLGDQVSVVEQLVSTRTGSVVWSNTAQLAVYGDARASATALHDVIVQASTRGFQALSPEALPTSRPAPPKRVAAAPTAPPSPGKVAAVLAFDGTAREEARNYVPASVIRTFEKYGVAGSRAALSTKDLGNLGPLVCAQTGADFLIGGQVAIEQEDPLNGIWFDTHLVLTGYDCNNVNAKPRSITENVTAGAEQTGIDIAVDRALKSYMAPPPAPKH